MKDFLKKLTKIQAQLKVPKQSYNKFGNFKYRSLEDIQQAVKPLLVENAVTLILDDKMDSLDDHLILTATATLYDLETENKISVSSSVKLDESKKGMDASQLSGSASSYARKYALNGLFLLDDAKDLDSMNPQNNNNNNNGYARNKPRANKPYKNNTDINRVLSGINMLARESNRPIQEIENVIKQQWGLYNLSDMTENQKKEIQNFLGDKIMKNREDKAGL